MIAGGVGCGGVVWRRALLACVVLAALPAAGPMTLQDYFALTGPAPAARIAYGTAASQYIELFTPPGAGPFPVVVLVHGGCWSAELGGMAEMRNMAGALVGQGIAVWNVEYRRIDEPGGGYPGTYQDIGAAFDRLAASAATYHLDTRHLVAMGHSAGGHLVQWAAGRARIAAASPLYVAHPLPVREVISLGGLADLRGQRAQIGRVCDVDVAKLTGAPTPARPDVYADTNAAALLPNGAHTVLIDGALDRISPPAVAAAYAGLARQAGDRADVVVLPGASHFDEVAATSPSWGMILPVVRASLGLGVK